MDAMSFALGACLGVIGTIVFLGVYATQVAKAKAAAGKADV